MNISSRERKYALFLLILLLIPHLGMALSYGEIFSSLSKVLQKAIFSNFLLFIIWALPPLAVQGISLLYIGREKRSSWLLLLVGLVCFLSYIPHIEGGLTSVLVMSSSLLSCALMNGITHLIREGSQKGIRFFSEFEEGREPLLLLTFWTWAMFVAYAICQYYDVYLCHAAILYPILIWWILGMWLLPFFQRKNQPLSKRGWIFSLLLLLLCAPLIYWIARMSVHQSNPETAAYHQVIRLFIILYVTGFVTYWLSECLNFPLRRQNTAEGMLQNPRSHAISENSYLIVFGVWTLLLGLFALGFTYVCYLSAKNSIGLIPRLLWMMVIWLLPFLRNRLPLSRKGWMISVITFVILLAVAYLIARLDTLIDDVQLNLEFSDVDPTDLAWAFRPLILGFVVYWMEEGVWSLRVWKKRESTHVSSPQ